MGNLLIFSFKTSFYLKGFGGGQTEIDPIELPTAHPLASSS
jgi:hypothetical protein